MSQFLYLICLEREALLAEAFGGHIALLLLPFLAFLCCHVGYLLSSRLQAHEIARARSCFEAQRMPASMETFSLVHLTPVIWRSFFRMCCSLGCCLSVLGKLETLLRLYLYPIPSLKLRVLSSPALDFAHKIHFAFLLFIFWGDLRREHNRY